MMHSLVRGGRRSRSYGALSKYTSANRSQVRFPNRLGRTGSDLFINTRVSEQIRPKTFTTEAVSSYDEENVPPARFRLTGSRSLLPLESPDPRVFSLLLEISQLIREQKYALAAEAFSKVLSEKGSIQSKPCILDLIDKFLTSQAEPIGANRLKLLFEKEIYRPEQCASDDLRQALTMQLISKSCDVGIFKLWDDFGRTFRKVMQHISRDIPPFQGTMLIQKVLDQVAVMHRSPAYNAVAESICGDVTPSYRMFGATLVRRMLDLKLRPSGRSYELTMAYYASLIGKAEKESLRYLKASKRLYYQMQSHRVKLPFKTHNELLDVVIQRSRNNISNSIYIIDLAFAMIEQRWPLCSSLSQALLNRLERVEPTPDSCSLNKAAERIKAIFRKLVSADGISNEKLFSVLLACHPQIERVGTKNYVYADPFLQLLHETSVVPNKRHYEATISLLGVSGDLGSAEATLNEMLRLNVHPDSKTLSSIISASIVAQAPGRGLKIAESLLGQGELYKIPPITPCTELYSFLTVAASLNLEIDLAKHYFKKYLETCQVAVSEADCCLRITRAFHIFLNYANLPKSIKAKALGCVDVLATHLHSASHLGSLNTVYAEVLSSHAEFLLTTPTVDDPECHMPMLNLYRSYFLTNMQPTTTSIYEKMLLALLNCLNQNPCSKERIMIEADMLYMDMLEYRLEFTCQVFASLISIAGNTESMERYFQSFLAYSRTEPRPDLKEIIQVLHAYGEACPLSPNKINQLISTALQFGPGPANSIRKLMIERLIFQDASNKIVWELLSDLEAHFIPQTPGMSFSPASHVRFPFPSIALIASHFLKTEGPQSLLRAVDVFERIGEIPQMHSHCATQLYTLLIRNVMDPHPFIQEDPIPLVAEFLSRLVAIPANPLMRKEFFSTLWRLSDQVTPRATPWSAWMKLRKMLERAESTTLPTPTPKDLLALF
ncbi:hypothetical protein DSO57_1016134 [Entomophthora muscae]|uniref:Uncharacterized protein n=2 Tax=Entomophthora muscae TaxID=34485 RepID=A0ACC2SHN4_9FUNG|nr:hypothetical protein DSO57_1016134 [Entomophthora muscae]